MTLILVVFTLRFPGFIESVPAHHQKLAWLFVNTHDWRQWIIWLLVQVKNILHMPDIVASDFSYPPTLD